METAHIDAPTPASFNSDFGCGLINETHEIAKITGQEVIPYLLIRQLLLHRAYLDQT